MPLQANSVLLVLAVLWSAMDAEALQHWCSSRGRSTSCQHRSCNAQLAMTLKQQHQQQRRQQVLGLVTMRVSVAALHSCCVGL
jgi:methylphosphotriester-DNA--protein-cysteine methyltransferase